METLRNIALSLIVTGLLYLIIAQLYENLKLTAEAEAEHNVKARVKRILASTKPPTVEIEVKGNWDQLQSGLYKHELKSDIDDLGV
jgi:hypothetical protein